MLYFESENELKVYNLEAWPLVKRAYKKNNVLISQPKHMLWVLKRTISSFEHPKHILQLMDKKIFTILGSFFSFF